MRPPRRDWLESAACLLLAILIWSGCSQHPPALPAVHPSELPDRWLEELASVPCPVPFACRLRMRIDGPGQPGVRVDGKLEAVPSEFLRLSAKLGVFRPLFNLFAVADSCELLVHDEQSYWITPRSEIDWNRMNPSAWVQALDWAFCPQRLVSKIETDDIGKMEDGIWTVSGVVSDSPYHAELGVDRRSGTIVSISVGEPGQPSASVRLRDHRYLEDRWMPTTIELSLPHADGFYQLDVELLGLVTLDPEEISGKGLIRPENWVSIGGPDRPDLWIPIPSDPSSGSNGEDR